MTLLLRTFTGKAIDVVNIDVPDVDIRDIAHALSLVTRFHGHCRIHYSVAQHSLLVADRVHRLTGDSTRTLKALLHDAGEAYVGDMSRPLKYAAAMEPFRNLSRKVQRVIDRAFGVELNDDPLIARVDFELLALEAAQLFDPPLLIDGAPAVKDLGWIIPTLGEWRAESFEQAFLAYFGALSHPTYQPHTRKDHG